MNPCSFFIGSVPKILDQFNATKSIVFEIISRSLNLVYKALIQWSLSVSNLMHNAHFAHCVLAKIGAEFPCLYLWGQVIRRRSWRWNSFVFSPYQAPPPGWSGSSWASQALPPEIFYLSLALPKALGVLVKGDASSTASSTDWCSVALAANASPKPKSN